MICPLSDKEDKKGDLELQRIETPAEIKRRRWVSCCFQMDREVVQYFMKYFILVSLMVFFSIELHLSDKCETDQLYTGLLSMVIGLALPSPRLNKG